METRKRGPTVSETRLSMKRHDRMALHLHHSFLQERFDNNPPRFPRSLEADHRNTYLCPCPGFCHDSRTPSHHPDPAACLCLCPCLFLCLCPCPCPCPCLCQNRCIAYLHPRRRMM